MIVPLKRDQPLTVQIYRHFARAIRAGDLRPGERLPASRTLAATHGIARNTVLAAYQQLASEGYLETRGSGGTVVARELRPIHVERTTRTEPRNTRARPAGRISLEGRRVARHGQIFAPLTLQQRSGLRWDFRYNASVADTSSRRAWARILRGFVRAHETSRSGLDPVQRPGPLHEQIARYLHLTRGVRAASEQIVLVHSPQAAFRILAKLLVDPGDEVLLEDPHYLGIRNTMLARGARVRTIPVDDRGLRTHLLPTQGHPRLVYTAPSHNWPTGASLPFARRLELLAWAKRSRAWILENDHNCETFYEGIPAECIQGLDDSQRVVYVGTFSRLLEPYPTIAYAVVPEGLIDAFHAESRLSGSVGSALERDALTAFLAGGEMEKLLRRASRRMRSLQHVLIQELKTWPCPVETRSSSGGLHVYARLPGWSAADVERLVAAAARAGVGIYPGAPFFMKGPRVPGILLGFAWLDADEIREGAARLAEVVRHVVARARS